MDHQKEQEQNRRNSKDPPPFFFFQRAYHFFLSLGSIGIFSLDRHRLFKDAPYCAQDMLQ